MIFYILLFIQLCFSLQVSLNSSIARRGTVMKITWAINAFFPADTISLQLSNPSLGSMIIANVETKSSSFDWTVPSNGLYDDNKYTIHAKMGQFTASSKKFIIASNQASVDIVSNRTDYTFTIPISKQFSARFLFPENAHIEVYARRDKPVIIALSAYESFFDSKSTNSNYTLGTTNCDKGSGDIIIYLTIILKSLIQLPAPFALQVDFTESFDCTSLVERSNTALMADLSGTIYDNDYSLTTKSFGYDGVCTAWNKIKVYRNLIHDAYSELWVDDQIKEIILVFRGTQNTSMINAISDMTVLLVPCTIGKYSSDNQCGSIHDGFLKTYKSISAEVMATLDSLPKDYTLHLTGHSLGAAMATIASFDMFYNTKFSKMTLTTFGCPAVVFYDFYHTMLMDSRMNNWRFVRRQLGDVPGVLQLDVVTTMTEPWYLIHVSIPTLIESDTEHLFIKGLELHSIQDYLSDLVALLPLSSKSC